MKNVAILLNAMVKAGVIETYAVFGAVAQVQTICSRHGFSDEWHRFRTRFMDEK